MLALCVLLVGGPGCDTTGQEQRGEGSTATTDSAPAADSSAGAVLTPPGPPPLPPLPGEGELRDFRLQLVNTAPGRVVVYASAGAARVVLDTVPGRDSTLVNLRVRAERVDLVAADEAGREIAGGALELLPDLLNRWEIRGGAAPGTPRQTVPDSLEQVDRPAYARVPSRHRVASGRPDRDRAGR